MPYAIIINVPEVRDECLVAMPFSGFEKLYDDVNAAATRIPQLKACRAMSGERETELEFPREVVSAIRSARLVVGICSGQGEPCVPNPNVMYEVGLAHALGKPTLLVTCTALPANLASRHALMYKPEEVGTDHLRDKLQLRMSALVSDRGNPLTDPRHADIHVAGERHVMFHNPLFWDHFRAILSFGKQVHDQHQLLDTSAMRAFRTRLDDAQKIAIANERHDAVQNAWVDFRGFFENFTSPNLYLRMSEQFATVDAAFALMRERVGKPLQDEVEACYGFYQTLRERMTGYPDQFRSLGQTLSSHDFTAGSAEAFSRVVAQVGNIAAETTGLIVWSDRLIVNLVDLIRRPGD